MPRGTKRNHNLNFEGLANDLAGGHEIYRFLAEAVVLDNSVCSSVAPVMRALNKTFRETVDPLIPQYMKEFNVNLAALHSAVAEKLTLPGQETSDSKETKQRRAEITNEITHRIRYVEAKFGYHTSKSLQKCVTEHGNRKYGVGTFGWLPQDTDVARMSTTVNSFLAMAGKHACELKCRFNGRGCICACMIGGTFAYVPQGKGLIMHCDEACIAANSLTLEPNRGTPIVAASALEPQDTRMKELSNSILIQLGIRITFSNDEMTERVGFANWQTFIVNPHNLLAQKARRSQHGSSALRFLMLNHPSLKATDCYAAVPTFQSIFRVQDSTIRAAKQHLLDAEKFEEDLVKAQRRLVRTHVEKQMERLLRERGRDHVIEYLDFKMLKNLLPGALELMTRAVFEEAEYIDVSRIRELHVLRSPFTEILVKTVVMALGALRRYDKFFSGLQASSFAYAFVTGLCAGKDENFEIRSLSSQLNTDVCDPNVSISCWKDMVSTMHAFDAVDFTTVVVTPCKDAEEMMYLVEHNGGNVPREGLVLKWQLKIGDATLSGPLILQSLSRKWLKDKKTAGEALLRELGYEAGFLDLPNDIAFRSALQHDEEGENVAQKKSVKLITRWVCHAAQHLCARPETRAIGLDLLTADNTRLFNKVVASAALDTETLATVGMVQQADEEMENREDE